MTFTRRLSLFALLLACSSPVFADDWALRLEENVGPEAKKIRTGRAQLDLGDELALTLNEEGKAPQTMPGIEVFGGYLFAESREAIDAIMPKAGMIAAIKSVTEIQQAETVAGGLRVRSLPTTQGSEIVGNLRGGQRVEVLEVKDGWAKVKVDYATTGWAKISGSKPYLRLTNVPKLTSIGGARSIFLSRRGPGWDGQVKQDTSWIGDIVLRDNTHEVPTDKRVLVIADRRHKGDGGAFNVYANRIKKTYATRGYQTVIGDIDSFEDVIDELKAATSAPYSRLVFISHGGWDGPIYRGHIGTRQVSGKYNVELYEKFVAAVKVGMTTEAKIFNSSCHAAGTARDEDVSYGSPYNWVHDLSKRTGLHVAGPAGKTSTEWTLQHVLATLEGQGVTVQEVHVARDERLKILYPGMSLNSVSSVPLPAIGDLPKPKADETLEPAPSVTASVIGTVTGTVTGTVHDDEAATPQPIPSARVDLNDPAAAASALESATRTDEAGQPVIGRRLGD